MPALLGPTGLTQEEFEAHVELISQRRRATAALLLAGYSPLGAGVGEPLPSLEDLFAQESVSYASMPDEAKDAIETLKKEQGATCTEMQTELTDLAKGRVELGMTRAEFEEKARQGHKRRVHEFDVQDERMTNKIIAISNGIESDDVRAVLAAALDTLTKFLEGLFAAIARFVRELIENIARWLQEAYNKIKDFFEDLRRKLGVLGA
jgi:hypothetical protein